MLKVTKGFSEELYYFYMVDLGNRSKSNKVPANKPISIKLIQIIELNGGKQIIKMVYLYSIMKASRNAYLRS